MSDQAYADVHFSAPKFMELLLGTEAVGYSWTCYADGDDDQGSPWSGHVHTINCLWVWHNCSEVLGQATIAPGQRWGWRATGVGAHTLVTESPLHIEASVYWPDCCGLHGFIRDGRWFGV